MAATITLAAENLTEDAFDDAIAELDRLEAKARDAGVSLGDVNEELESRRARDYADAVRRAADELDGTADAARRADEETDRLAARDRRITALATSFSAVKDGLEVVGEVAERTYDLISRLAEGGDAGMQQLKASIDRAGGSAEGLAGRLLSVGGELTVVGRAARSTAEDVSWLTAALAGMTEAEAEHATRLSDTAQLLEQYNALAAERRRLQGIAANEDLAALEAQAADILRTIEESQRGERDPLAKADVERMLATRDLITARIEELRKTNSETAAAEADAWRKAAEERAEAERLADEEAAKRREEERRRLADLEASLRRDADQAERAARQEEAEHWLKLQGLDKQIHESRLAYLRKETELRVDAATTEEEKARARAEGQRAIDEELHRQRMAQIDAEHAKKLKAAEEEQEQAQAKPEPVADRLARGDRFADVVADRQQAAEAEFRKRNEKFLAEINDPNSRLTDRERQQGAAELRRELAGALREAREEALREARAARERGRPEPREPGEAGPRRSQEEIAAELERRRAEMQERNRELAERSEANAEREAERRERMREDLARRQEEALARRQAEREARDEAVRQRREQVSGGGDGAAVRQLAQSAARQGAAMGAVGEQVAGVMEQAAGAIADNADQLGDVARRLEALERGLQGDRQRARAITRGLRGH